MENNKCVMVSIVVSMLISVVWSNYTIILAIRRDVAKTIIEERRFSSRDRLPTVTFIRHGFYWQN